MTTQTIRTTWTLTDGESGETAVIQSLGTGGDTGDKFSPKAQTNSMKYALLMGFLLSTGDDPELSDSSDRRPRRQQERAESASAADPFNAGLVGTAEKGKGNADFELRLEATHGHILIFRLTEGRKGWKVYARGPLAEMIAEYREGIEGKRVTCWGTFSDESWDKKGENGTKQTIVYQVLNLTRLKVGALDLTAPEPEEDEPELSAEDEAELATLFDAAPVGASA